MQSHTLRTALKYSPASQEEAFEMAQVANHYDQRATSGFGSIVGSYSAPDIRMSHDRGADGAAAWQQSNGDPHNYTVARASKQAELEAYRIARNKKQEPYERGFWRAKPDYVEGTRMTVAQAKKAEAARHATNWNSDEVKQWMREKKKGRLNPGPQKKAGVLLAGISQDGLGSKFADKNRDSVKLLNRKQTIV